ncbi:GntR family transcriptional regulator [Rhodoligotrophos defluvii]|uniref:GntR family transcriptional regulator n=1 Tax=Rhodoligotrophos defluvii TaxID=2561934 RepID=UPI001EF10B66|nr:GntR family transcriptional regulator [Rhodoligotrophos defluvii]
MARTKNDKPDPTAVLRRAIETGHFMPSQRLVETELAAWLGTNRSNVKLALGKLEQEGLVVSEPNRGARVRVISEREALEILQVRTALESLIARQAAEKATSADHDRLREILQNMRDAIDQEDFTGYSGHNGRLHAEIRKISGHETASRLLAMLNSQLVRFQFRTILYPGRIHQSLREHTEIVTAICAGDGDRAEKAMRDHLANVTETLGRSLAALAQLAV